MGKPLDTIDAALAQLDAQDLAQREEIAAGVGAYRAALAPLIPRLEKAEQERLALVREEGPRIRQLLERPWRTLAAQYQCTVEVELLTCTAQEVAALLADDTDRRLLTQIANLTAPEVRAGRVPRIQEFAEVACCHPRDIEDRLAVVKATLATIASIMQQREPAHQYGDAPPRPEVSETHAVTDFKVR
jgi:hypothetical protein